MAKEIVGTTATGNFPPTVRLEKEGDSVRGEVLGKRSLGVDQYGHIPPVIAIKIMDLEGGSVTRYVSKGVYEEVSVDVGDTVEMVGQGTDLREKLVQLETGNIVTITNNGTSPKKPGRQPKKLFRVTVE